MLYQASSGSTLQQPTWSPDADAIAFSEVVPSGQSRVVVVSAIDGSELAAAATPPVFFLYWTPDSRSVTFLHAEPNARAGGPPLVLGALNVATGKARYLLPGGPLFYAMGRRAGSSTRLLVHNSFLKEVSATEIGPEAALTAQAPVVLSSAPAQFRAPLLVSDSKAEAEFALLVEQGDATTAVVAVALSSPEGEAAARTTVLDLGEGSDATLLVASPDGTAVACLRTRAGTPGPERTIVQEVVLCTAPTPSALVAADDSHRSTEVLPSAQGATLCFFFSPCSRKLLCLDAAATAVADNVRASWSVYELTPPFRRTSFDAWTPSAYWLQRCVPFADQYAHSITPWAPDSSAFCYTSADGTVHVQRLDAPRPEDPWGLPLAPDPETLDAAPVADIAFWSPC